MKLECQAKSSDSSERKTILQRLNQWANCFEIGDVVYASYCGADRRLADAIIAVVESCRDHEIRQSEGG